MLDALDLLGTHFAQQTAIANDQRAWRNAETLGDHGVGRNDAMRPNACARHDRRADGDHRARIHLGAVHARVMAERRTRSDAGGMTGRALDDAIILNVGPGLDHDRRLNPTHDRAVPDAAINMQRYVSFDARAGGDEDVQRPLYRPVHSGFRFSRKAETPSRKSSD